MKLPSLRFAEIGLEARTVGRPPARVNDAVYALRKPSVTLYAPAEVDVTRASTLTVSAVVASDKPNGFQLDQHAVLWVTRPDTRDTWAVRWTPYRRIDDAPESDFFPTPRGFFEVGLMVTELRKRVAAFGWRPGPVVLQLLCNENETETVSVTLTGGAFLDDPKVVAFLKQQNRFQDETALEYAPAEAALLGDTVEGEDPGLLPVPAEEGLVAAVTPVGFAGPEARLVLSLAFRAKLLPGERLRFAAGDAPDASGQLLAARVPVTVVLSSPELVDPEVVRLSVPVYHIEEHTGTEHGLARLRLDLGRFEAMPKGDGRYYIRVNLGALQSETLTATLVPENLRPLRGR